jgi:hypothetical protein
MPTVILLATNATNFITAALCLAVPAVPTQTPLSMLLRLSPPRFWLVRILHNAIFHLSRLLPKQAHLCNGQAVVFPTLGYENLSQL